MVLGLSTMEAVLRGVGLRLVSLKNASRQMRTAVGMVIRREFGTTELPSDLGSIFMIVDPGHRELHATFTLDIDDLPGSRWPGPWLADLYVHPASRRIGLASLIIESLSLSTTFYAWCKTPMYWPLFLVNGMSFVGSEEMEGEPVPVAVFRSPPACDGAEVHFI